VRRVGEEVDGDHALRDEGVAVVEVGRKLGPILQRCFGRSLRTKIRMVECMFVNMVFVYLWCLDT
jgi:hypothetical protein